MNSYSNYIRQTITIFSFFLLFNQVTAQENRLELKLQQLVDSVNYLIKNSKDGFVQPIFSINSKGDISILNSQKSGFRFNISSLREQDKNHITDGGISFVPENTRSITTNKFILFIDQNGKKLGLFKFTRTEDVYVRKIHELLLQIRSYFIKKK